MDLPKRNPMQSYCQLRRIVVSLGVGLTFLACEAPAIDLMGIYSLARQSDPTYLAAGSTHEAALEGPDLARAPLLPQVSASGNLGPKIESLNPPGNPRRGSWQGQMSLTVDQTIYNRALLADLEQAKSVVAQADIDYAFQLQELMLRAATRYFAVLNSIDGLRFANANKQAIFEQLKQAQQRFDVGLIAITGVEEAKAEFDLATSTAIDAEKTLSDSLEELREITATYYGDNELASLGAVTPLVAPEPDDINAWTEIAFSQNLQVASANYAVVIAKQEITVQNSGHYPRLSLQGLATKSDRRNVRGTAIGPDTEEASLFLQLEVPIFTGWSVSANTRAARANYRRALNEYELSRRTVQSLTRRSFTGVKSGIAVVQALKQAVVSNKSALDAVQAGFQVGTRTSVDVLDRQSDFFRAEFSYAEARYEYILDVLKLKQAAGTLAEDDLRIVNSWLKQRTE